MRACLLIGCLGLGGLLPAGGARAEDVPPSGEALIAAMDRIHTAARDQYFEYDVVTEEAGKAPRSMRFAVTLNDKRHRRVEFLEPGDIRGMRVLTMDTSRIWLWLPAYKKVRKMASHAKAQSFMGTALSSEDGSMVTYGDLFAGRLLAESPEGWSVEAVRRPGADVTYARLVFELRRDLGLPSAIHYFNETGQEVKTETRQSYECKQGLCAARVHVVIDHTRGELKTTMVRRNWKHNQGVAESFFSVRALQRG